MQHARYEHFLLKTIIVCRDDLVIGAGTNAGALLVDGLGDGLLLEAPEQDFDFLRNTSFNLLQGCRMRNTKTVKRFSSEKKGLE